MASIGHVAVGLAAARADAGPAQRPTWPAMVFWSALALLPDIDVVGFMRGVPYGAAWGHRGATHSLLLAAAGGVATGLAARSCKRPVGRVMALAVVVLASHGLLDTMTDGGLGIALLWPFSLARFFAPWQPIPVAPIGPAFFTLDGMTVALSEIALFLPLWLFAFRVRVGMPAVALWLVLVWLIGSSDPVRCSRACSFSPKVRTSDRSWRWQPRRCHPAASVPASGTASCTTSTMPLSANLRASARASRSVSGSESLALRARRALSSARARATGTRACASSASSMGKST